MIQHPSWLMWSDELSAKDCADIIAAAEKDADLVAARTFRTGQAEDDGNDGHRLTNIRWLNNEAFPDLHDLVWRYARAANETFDLSLSRLPSIQFTEYAEPGHHYDTHHDIDWYRQDSLHRKLSVCIQLSDPDKYEGGDFTFENTENPDPEALRMRGTVLAFPSYHDHSVSPIVDGCRYSLVAWVEGPRWR